jgi:exopolyphosphatase/guanosine-5'-triphosphate,3'-diphosphate pyrophosphatase
MRSLASIDLGTHTARLLIAQPTGQGSHFKPLLRERNTIRLAQGIGTRDVFEIPDDALERAVEAIREFTRIVRDRQGDIIGAVCTGIIRSATNRDSFLKRLKQGTGVRFIPISGDEEAVLTAKGVLSAFGNLQGPFVVFDLGGGTTELFFGSGTKDSSFKVISLPLGALVLKEAYLKADPPGKEELHLLGEKIDSVLSSGIGSIINKGTYPRLIGTGGTVTTLGSMVWGIETSRITPELMNGLVLEMDQLEALYNKIVTIPLNERYYLKGLDRGRADVIPAGALVVLRIMQCFRARELSVCLSDILEGVLISFLEGAPNDQ